MFYYVIDAFTETKFGGNPAGVVIHEHLDEHFMQKFMTLKIMTLELGEIFQCYDELAELFSINSSEIGDQKFNLLPQSASTGLWDIMLPIKTKEALYALKPNFEAIAKYTEAHAVGGIHAFTLDCKSAIAESRNFCPLFGIDEESATGTSTGALSYYLYENNVLNQFDECYQFLQGYSMDRPSQIMTKLINPQKPTVMVGGNAVILSKGRLL